MDKEGEVFGSKGELIMANGKELVRMVLALGTICFFSSALLSFVYAKTKDVVEHQKEMAKKSAMVYVLPSAKEFEENKGCNCFVGKDDKGDVVGYVFTTSERGYSSEIVLVVGVDKDLVITGVKVLSQNETPGLGTRITEVKYGSKTGRPWFLEQFWGKGLEDLPEVKTISGATISSSAVIRAVKNGLERLKSCLESQGSKD